jgi:predicted secreted protein
MRKVSTKPDAQDGAVPPAAAATSDGNAEAGNAEASPPASPEQIYEQAMARLAAIIDEWQKARDACLRE